MKQNTNDKHTLLFSNTEIEASSILLDLQNLITNRNQFFNKFSKLTSWGFKKRRSDRGNNNNNSNTNNDFSSLQGSSKVDYYYSVVKTDETVVNSPATPLSFSPSESDDKSKHSSRKFTKRKTRAELMDMIKQLSQCRESLRGEVENVRNYYNNQKAYNLKLKAMKEQVTRMLNLQGGGINLGQMYNNHQQPFIMDQITIGSETYQRFQYPLGQLQQAQQPLFSSTNGLGCVNKLGLGPVGLPDLNVTVDEAFTMDSPSTFDMKRINAERMAQFAAARRRRMIKRKEIKSSSGLIRPPRRR